MGDSKVIVRPPCLKCGSRNVAWIQWGRPIWRNGMEEKLDRREITLGSCFITKKVETWECNECKHRFGSHSLEPLMRKREGKSVPVYMKACQEAWLYPERLQKSEVCGCYHCLRLFNYDEIEEWVTDIREDFPTALCPFCHQDSVIGDSERFSLTKELLTDMRNFCYEENEW